jgi:AraC family transcriptional activator of pobA
MIRRAALPQTTLENTFLFRTFRAPVNVNRYRRGHFPLHFHDFFEIMIVNESTGRQVIDRVSHALKRGQVYFLSHFHAHEIFKTDGRGLDYYNISFKPEAVSLPVDSDFGVLKPFLDPAGVRPMQLDQRDYQSVAALCELACGEIEEAGRNVIGIVTNLLGAILAYLGRYTSFVPEDGKELVVLKTIARIGESYGADLTTRELAADLGLSPPRLSQIFRQRTGRTVKEILVERRLMEAKRLLAETGLPVTRVILDCGFNDMAYFHRAFKADTGCTPTQYREDARRVRDAKSSPH